MLNSFSRVAARLAACVILLSCVMPIAPARADILDPTTIPKYVDQLVIPPVMPRAGLVPWDDTHIDYYEIAVRQFQQAILPFPLPTTTVWSYGAVNRPSTFNYPAFTIEVTANKPIRVKWINGLVDEDGNFLPHLLPVDQTLHWANPPGGEAGKDGHGTSQEPYTGPVPIITHVHGAHVGPESDGHPEAWFLPNANNIPAGYATKGTHYGQFDPFNTEPGTAVFQYPNTQPAATLWYHDHALGMTRSNVYAGPAGFYLVRGGPYDSYPAVFGTKLPTPAPKPGDNPGIRYREIPMAIQDRSFNEDGSLFYPADRAFFEGLQPDQLQIPFQFDPACDGMLSDVAPIWNPEFFGTTMLVNGKTWPTFTVEPVRYRFRLLNGCNGRFVILKITTSPTRRPGIPQIPFWQIGAEGGFLPKPVKLLKLLMSPAERADVIVDFTGIKKGTVFYLINEGPDGPFSGGVPGVDFPFADPTTTGQVMRFVVGTTNIPDSSTPPQQVKLPTQPPIGGPVANTRKLSLNEMESETVFVVEDPDGNIVLDCDNGSPFGPTMALLGIMGPDDAPIPLLWSDPTTEKPVLNTVETWEIHNFTEDAHPIHLHMVQFRVLDRTPTGDPIGGPTTRPFELWESGYKDTVIAFPGEVTRVKARFDIPGLFVWHCHIVEHEDNEMMRNYEVVLP